MSLSIKSLALALATVTSAFAFGGNAQATEPAHTVDIPAQLINTPDVDDATGPCSLCRVHKIKVSDPQQQEADLEIYYDDDSGTFTGQLELTLLMYDGQYQTRTVETVVLLEQEQVLVPLPSDIDWAGDVQHAWVELVRTAG